MDNPFFVHIADARSIVADKHGELWLPMSESSDLSRLTEIVDVSDVYFDVVGYSDERDALLLVPIVVEGSAEYLEEELAEYIDGH